MKIKTLMAFAAAWQTGEPDSIMEFFDDDSSYHPSIANQAQRVFNGRAEIRKRIVQMIAHDQATASKVSNVQIHGDFGVWEWTYTTPSGIITGCDLFTFRENKILTKNAFRKITEQ